MRNRLRASLASCLLAALACGGKAGPTPPEASQNDAAITHCTDGVKDGGETDVDCGGPCPPCISGKLCLLSSDCLSGNCSGGVCL